LALAADRRDGSALAVVAAQASLALTRTRLTDEISETRRDKYFRALVQNSTDVILIVGDHGLIRYASPSAAKLFPNSTVDGRRLPALIAEPDRSEADALCAAMQRRQPVAQPSTVHSQWRVEGSPERRVEVSCVDLRGEPAVDGVVVTLRDVTERRQLEERLTALARHDPLTGLGNRALFMTAVENAVLQAPDTSAVLFIDLDDFKVVNDTFGHALGDALLRETAARIRARHTAGSGPVGQVPDPDSVVRRTGEQPGRRAGTARPGTAPGRGGHGGRDGRRIRPGQAGRLPVRPGAGRV
jgi:PAS domain S-box-containing protein